MNAATSACGSDFAPLTGGKLRSLKKEWIYPAKHFVTAGSELGEILAILQYLADELDGIKAQLFCQRCMTPAPPPARWHGDAKSRDDRPAHTCGRMGMR